MIHHVGIVIPVHDEEELLPLALASLERACDAVADRVSVHVVIVLDSCSDASAAIAREFCGAGRLETVAVEARNVGRARALGVETVLRHFANAAPSTVWVATTDADSTVPSSWICDQLDLARSGADAMTGVVRVEDWSEHQEGHARAFEEFYASHGTSQRHAHVHGANFGARADAYLAVGGFPSLASGEDHALVEALEKSKFAVAAARHVEVRTSGRLRGRAPDGFANFLAESNRRVA